MVAIKNNIINKTNILDTNFNSEKTDELFAELFALMNLEKLDENNKNLAKNFINQPINQKIIPELEGSKITNSKNLEFNKAMKKIEILENDNEIELAKSLIEVFYKEIGVTEPSNLPKEISKNFFKPFSDRFAQANPNNPKKSITNSNEALKDSNLDVNKVREQNFVINIIKEPSKNKKLSKIDNSLSIPKNANTQTNSKVQIENPLNELKNNSKETKTNLNQQVTLIEKKNKKKNKQFAMTGKIEESRDIQTKISKSQTNSNVTNVKINTSKDNQFFQKKETNDKRNFKMSDSKPQNINPNGKDFLDLLESSWGEKFSKIIKSSVNNGLNKLQIELKPKNLGKLNLEVSVKNNVTSINIGSENQEVVTLLNDNLPKLIETIDKETKSFSSMMGGENNQNNYFNDNKNKQNLLSNGTTSDKKEKPKKENLKISNHNIDVKA